MSLGVCRVRTQLSFEGTKTAPAPGGWRWLFVVGVCWWQDRQENCGISVSGVIQCYLSSTEAVDLDVVAQGELYVRLRAVVLETKSRAIVPLSVTVSS